MKRITQEEWDRRASSVSIQWLEEVGGANSKTRARCLRCGYEFLATPSVITRASAAGRDRSCRKCKTTKDVSKEEWEKRATRSRVDLVEDVKRSDVPVTVRCKVCRETFSTYPRSLTDGKGCRKLQCGGWEPQQEDWDARIASVGARWLAPVGRALEPVPAECLKCGLKWKPAPSDVNKGSGCPKCGGNFTTTQDWEERAEESGVELLEDPVGKRPGKVQVRCKSCGLEWAVDPTSLWRGNGCPRCADFGFDHSGQTLLYLIRSGPVGKIGVTNDSPDQPSMRLREHAQKGFEPVAVWRFETGTEALTVEDVVLNWWRNDLKLDPVAAEVAGSTETVRLDEVSVEEIIKFVQTNIRVLGVRGKLEPPTT